MGDGHWKESLRSDVHTLQTPPAMTLRTGAGGEEWGGEEGDEKIENLRAWKIHSWGITDHLRELGFIHL